PAQLGNSKSCGWLILESNTNFKKRTVQERLSMSIKLSERARAYLNELRFAVLGTINRDGTPQLTTMWYLLEGDIIVMNTKVGRAKERNMRRDPRISVCIADG